MAASLAIGAAAVVAAVHVTGPPAGTLNSRPGAAVSVARILQLAARTSVASAPPAGARWIVTETRETSNVSAPYCWGTAQAISGRAYAEIFSVLSSCPATPPAFLSVLRDTKGIAANGPGSLGYPLGLPGQPRLLLTALYRWLNAYPGDSLPVQPAPHVPAADLNTKAFDTLFLMISDGVTTPSQGVLLQALGEIPGVKVVRLANDGQGRPGLGVTSSTGGGRETLIIDPATYKIVGDSSTYASYPPGSGSITTTDTQLWRAYYDAAGHKL